MKSFLPLIIPVFFFFEGCSQLQHQNLSTQEQKKIRIAKLQKEIKELDAQDKRLIYKSIKEEITLHKDLADRAYKESHYYDALKNYKLVNFYEGYNAIPAKKIKRVESISKKRAKRHYKKAKRYLKKNKKRALYELNLVRMNLPQYKETQKLYRELLNTQEIKTYLLELSHKLDDAISNYKGGYKALQAIKKQKQHLAKYDYKHSSVLKADKLLENEKELLLHNALTLYKQKKFYKAKKQFYQIHALYPNNTTAKKYIQRINFKQSKQHNLYTAKEALKNKEYNNAIASAQKVLQLQPSNKQAKQIIKEAKKQAQAAVEENINKGKKAYSEKRLDLAKEYFEKVLTIDPKNKLAILYHKRIHRQLQTLKSLQ